MPRLSLLASPRPHSHNRPRPAAAAAVSLGTALALALAAPAGAQQVVYHAPLLPAPAGLNPLGLGAMVADPGAPDLYAVTGRGLTVLDRGSDTFVSFELGPGGSSFANDMAFDAVSRRLFLSDGGGDAVLVLDGATRTVLARIPAPFTPARIALDPTARRLYLLSATTPQIAALELGTLAITPAATLPDQPSRLAVHTGTGRVFVTSSAAGVTWALEPSLTLRTTIATGASSTEITVNPVANKAYVVRTDGNVAIVDTAGEAVIRTVTVSSPSLVVAHTGTGFAYVASATAATFPALPESQIVAIDAGNNALAPVRLAGTPVGNTVSALVLDQASDRLFASELVKLSVGRVTVFSTSPALARVGAGLTNQGGAAPMAWSASTGRIYVASPSSVVSELNPTTFAVTQIVLGTSLVAGGLHEAAAKSFALDAASDQAIQVDLAAPASAPVRTPTGAGPQLATLAPAANQLYVLNQIERSISVLDATTGAKLRDKTGVAADTTLAFALDPAAPGGPRGLLVGLTSTLLPASPSWVQTYEPQVSDRLTSVSGNCFTTPCVLGFAADANPTAHRFYVSGVYNIAAAASLAVFDPAATPTWRNITIPNAQQLPGFVVRYDAPTNRVFVSSDTTTQARLVAVEDVIPAVVTPLSLGSTATALELANGLLYVAEAAGGQIEIFDANTLALVNPVATGGAPVDLEVMAGVPYLWVQNDGLASPGVQVYDVNGQRAFLSDIGFGGLGRTFNAPATGNLTVVDNLHGSIVTIDSSAAPSDMQIDPAALPDGTTAQAYAAALAQAGGGAGPFLWELTSGTLPPGLALDPATGAISGTPTQEGLFSFMIRLTDSSATPARVDMEDFQIQILDLRILTTELPKGQCGSYSVQLLAGGGVPPYSWATSALPAGLSLDPATGIISGTPTGTTTCPPLLDVTLTDSLSTQKTAALCLEVAPAGNLPLFGNSLKAFHTAADVVIDLPALVPPVIGHNVYRSSPPFPVTWTRLGGTPSTTNPLFWDLGALTASPALLFYSIRNVDACGNESADPLF